MSQLSTTKRITLAKLALELGGISVNCGDALPDSDHPKTIEADVPMSILETVVAAHIFEPDYELTIESKNLKQDYSILKQWAQDATSLVEAMTTANRALTLQEQRVIVTRLGRLCDRMADIIRENGYG
jgi:hypothetical protein